LGCRHRNVTVDRRESSEEGRQGAEEHLEDHREEAAPQEGVVRHLHLQGAEAGAPNTGISSKAMSIMNSFVNDIFERIAAEASRLLFTRSNVTSQRRTTTPRALEALTGVGRTAHFFFSAAVMKYFERVLLLHEAGHLSRRTYFLRPYPTALLRATKYVQKELVGKSIVLF